MRSMQELLAAALKRKHEAIRTRLGIQPEARIEGLALESLAYHLTERSGAVAVKLEGEKLRVGEPGATTGLVYEGEAIALILKAWRIREDEARAGLTFEVQSGARVG